MSDPKPQGNAPRADWEAVERDYTAGILSNRDIAAKHGVSEAAVRKHAKAKGWLRNLKGKINARAEALLEQDAAHAARGTPQDSPLSEREVVETAALNVSLVRKQHRLEADRLRAMTGQMLVELERYGAEGRAVIQKAVAAIAAKKDGMDAATLRKLQSILSLGSRADILKKLGETLRLAVSLEREAYGMAGIPLDQEGNPERRDADDDSPIKVTIRTLDASIDEPED